MTPTSDLLRSFGMFSELNGEHLAMLAEHSQLQHIPRGTLVFQRGDPAMGLYLLIQGQLKLGVISPQGMEKVIHFVSPGESFGEAVLFLEMQLPVFAEAMQDSKVLLVPKKEIFSLLEQDALVSRKMLAGLSMRMHKLIQDIEMLSLQSCTQRFIGYLLQISAQTPDASRVKLPASKANIASLLNLTPETLSRTLSRLQQTGVIEVQGKDIVITDVASLRNYKFQ